MQLAAFNTFPGIVYSERRMRQKTILITGATGFLGSYIARELFEAGFHLKPLVRKTTTGAKEQLSEVFPANYGLKALLKRIEIIEGDISRNYLGLGVREYVCVLQGVESSERSRNAQ